MMKSIIQSVAIFMLVQFAISQFFGNKQSKTEDSGAGNVGAFDNRPSMAEVQNATAIPSTISPIWPTDSTVDISIYVSPSIVMPSFRSLPPQSLVLEEKNFKIGDYKDSRQIETSIAVPKQVQQNGTLFAHFYIALSGQPLDPTSPHYSVASASHFIRPFTQYLPKKKQRKLKNLLDKKESQEVAEAEVEEVGVSPGPTISNYYHPNFTLSFIPDSGVMPNFQTMHPAIRKHVELERTGARDASGRNGWYYPIVFVNTFWQLRSQMTEINSTVESLPLYLTLNNLANWKFSLVASLDEGMKEAQTKAASGAPMPAGPDGSEMEKIKEVLLDTNPYLLGTTAFVSVLHMIFEALAFKSDIVRSPPLSRKTTHNADMSFSLTGARRRTMWVHQSALF